MVKRYIAAWLSRDEERHLQDVEFATGINVRTIHDIMHGKRDNVYFDTADQILVRLGYMNAWREDPDLTPIYAAA